VPMSFSRIDVDMRPPWFSRSDGLFLLIASGIACFSAACVAIATSRGADMSHDSVAYIGAVRSLVEGRGLVIPFGADQPVPLTRWPPLYPLVLAMAGAVTHDIEGAARWLSAGLFALNTILIAALGRKLTNCAIFGYAAAVVFASSFTMLRLHTMAMAEPLFILLALVCTYYLDDHLTTGKTAPLLAASVAAGLIVVTRYAGLPFIVWGAIVVFFRHRSSMRPWIDAVIWTLAAAAPIMLVTAWNVRGDGWVAHRTLTWHPQSGIFFSRMLAGVTECILPESLPHRNWVMAAGCLVLTPIAARYLIRRPEFRASYLAFLIALNVAFLIGVGLFLGLDADLDIRRAIKPVFPFLILLAVCAGSRLLRTRTIRIAVLSGVCAAMALPNSPDMYRWVVEGSQSGLGFGNRQWRESATIAFIQNLPAKTVVYTNLPEPVYLVTGRNARFLPIVEDMVNRRRMTAAEIDLAVSGIAGRARSGDAVAVYFVRDEIRLPIMIAASDLAARCGLTRVIAFDDGTAYTSGDAAGSHARLRYSGQRGVPGR